MMDNFTMESCDNEKSWIRVGKHRSNGEDRHPLMLIHVEGCMLQSETSCGVRENSSEIDH